MNRWICLITLAAAACGSEQKKNLTPEEFCAKLGDTFAHQVGSCFGWDTASAKAVYGPLACAGKLDAAKAGRLGFDAAAAENCLGALQSSCTEFNRMYDGNIAHRYPKCDDVFLPKVADGEPCTDGNECTSTFCDLSNFAVCPGKCAATAKLGEVCGSAPCGSGLYCDSSTHQCVSEPQEAWAGYGQPCSSVNGIVYCDYGLSCDSTQTPEICVPALTSGTCNSFNGPYCAPKYQCQTPPQASDGQCQPVKALGEACTPGNYECGFLMYCASDTRGCTGYSKLGQPCGTASTGESILCLEGACSTATGMGTCVAKSATQNACGF